MIITPLLVIFLIVVFILLFLFLNTVDKRKWLSGIISLILTPFVFFFIFYPFLNIISSYHYQKYFDSEAWLEQPALRNYGLGIKPGAFTGEREYVEITFKNDTVVALKTYQEDITFENENE